jgi:hypothetical protein
MPSAACSRPDRLDRVDEFLVVLLVLVSVPPGEVDDRRGERVAAVQVLRDGYQIPGPAMRPGQARVIPLEG